jgi:hypothetical protein
MELLVRDYRLSLRRSEACRINVHLEGEVPSGKGPGTRGRAVQ